MSWKTASCTCPRENGDKTTEGTPQGGVISPLLANLIGDVIDKPPECIYRGFVRYADDFVVMTKSKEELPAALSCVKEIIEGKLAMKLSEGKTKLTNFKTCPHDNGERLQISRI